MQTRPDIGELLLRWEEFRDEGKDVSAEELCRDCPELLEELRKRIHALVEMYPMLETARGPNCAPNVVTPNAPTSIVEMPTLEPRHLPEVPGYRLLHELGHGGMGIVYKAEQLSLNRVVALKMIRAAAQATPEDIARFQIEAEAVARLQHPHIVQIHEVGTLAGCPYFSLEYVDGGSLASKSMPLPARQAAELVEMLARAIHHAHEKGIVHRDLKPANILLQTSRERRDESREPGENGQERLSALDSPLSSLDLPKITDFGLAKLAQKDSGHSESGSIMGTPSYMAPEQAAGKTREIGPAVDIYALGAILYELLTGRPPFRAESPWETITQVISLEPAPPRVFQPKTPRDLETISLKCLEKAPLKRYATALALADDLRRFLNGEPIAARPVSAPERLLKWVRRRPALTGLLAVSLLAVVGLLGVWLNYSLDLEAAIEQTTRERNVARKAESKATGEWQKARRSLYALQLALVGSIYESDPGRGRELLEDVESCPPDLRDFIWGLYYRACRRERFTLTGHKKDVRAIAFGHDGKMLVSGSHDGSVKLWNAANGRELASLAGGKSAVTCAALSHDDTLLAAGCQDGSLDVWETASRKRIASLRGNKAALTSVAFAREGRMLAFATPHGVELWSFKTKTEGTRLSAAGVSAVSVAISADGNLLAVASDEVLRLWDLRTQEQKSAFKTPKGGMVISVQFSGDGRRLGCCDQDGFVQVFEFDSGKRLTKVQAHRTIPLSVALSPDGSTVAAAGVDGLVRLWDVATGREKVRFAGHKGNVWSVAFSPDGQTLASAGKDGALRVWELEPKFESATFSEPKRKNVSMALAPDGRTIASAGADRKIKLWDVAAAKVRSHLTGHKGAITALAYGPTGKLLASASGDGTIRLWNDDNPNEPVMLTNRSPAWCIAFSPDGHNLASGDQAGIRLWDIGAGQARTLATLGKDVLRVAFSPDGKLLAGSASDGSLRLFDVATGGERMSFHNPGASVFALAFDPSGDTLVSGDQNGVIRLWDLATQAIRRTLDGHRKEVLDLAFSPDGRFLVSGASDGTLRFWDPSNGQERLVIPAHGDGGIHGVSFAGDGILLATSSPGDIKLFAPTYPARGRQAE